MGLRYRKSIKIAKGVKINLNKSSTSVTFGTKGFHHTISSTGKRTTSAGISGTGLSNVTTSGGRSKGSSRRRNRSSGYSSSNSGNRLYTDQQLIRQQQKNAEIQKNMQMVDDYEQLLYDIRSIHKICGDSIDWKEQYGYPAPYNYPGVGPCEREALEAINNFKPSLLGKLFPSADQEKREKLEQELQIAREQDEYNYNDWSYWKNLAGYVLDGDIDSYFHVITEMRPFEDILDFGSDFDVGTDDPTCLEVEFHVKSDKVVPNHVLSLTKTGKLSSKAMTKTMHFDILQDYICSCIIRIAREMFALLPIDRIAIHAMDTIKDDEGNSIEDVTVVSVLIRREQLEGLDFENIDPSDTIETFDCHMEFKKTKGLVPVERVRV